MMDNILVLGCSRMIEVIKCNCSKLYFLRLAIQYNCSLPGFRI